MRNASVHSLLAMHLAVASIPPATASWLSAAELQSHCNSYVSDSTSRDGALCAAFIQGFIAGANTTEQELDALLKSVDSPANENFAERAARTRVGNRLDRYAASNYSRYCVGDELGAATVIEQVAANLKGETDYRSPDDGPSADEMVRAALLRTFPCDRQ